MLLIYFIKIVRVYTEVNSKFALEQGGALILSKVKQAAKQLNLNKLSDAAGIKSNGCRRSA
jgi:hypothetical protein